jgi:exodeoxyribonuclease III
MNLNNLFSNKYKSYWYCPTEKKGYSGTGILTKYEPISVSYGMNIEKHDKEGRIITMEYDKFYLICCYTPNSGQELKRLNYRLNEWDKDFFEYINSLKSKKDIILTGDLNVAKENIDIFEPKGHEKFAGFTQREKESFRKFLKTGYIDTFRKLHPNEQKFSFFAIKKGFNAKPYNKGWRLDYFVINKDPKNIVVKDSDMLDKDKYNASDHIPLVFTFSCKA